MYLPTIAFVLKSSHLKLQAFAYLLLYNTMFILPLLAVFVFALAGATSEDFGRFIKRHMLLVKLLMAALFFGLGMFLLWRP
jgi:cytochrome c biogenesis protein CcdA